jgi:hypothetical protein
MKPFVYVQWFTIPRLVPSLKMHLVKPLASSRKDSFGIIELTSIARFIQLIPDFGSVDSSSLTANNSMNTSTQFLINSFADKEIFQAIW